MFSEPGISGSPKASSNNPYDLIHEKIKNTAFPRVLPISYPLLVFMAVWRFLIIILCIGTLAAHKIFKKEGEKSDSIFWFYRKVFINGESSTPYYVPNHLMVLSGAEILTSTAFLVFTILTYIANKSPDFEMSSYLEIWYSLLWIPACLGVWIAGWGYVYVCICSPDTNRAGFRAIIFHPVLLNSLCLSIIGVFVTGSIFWVTRTFLSLRRLYDEYNRVDFLLKKGSAEWKQNRSGLRSKALLHIPKLTPLADKGHQLIETFQASSLWWLLVASLLGIFHLLAAISLLRLMRRTLKTSETRVGSVFNERPVIKEKSWTSAELSRGYRKLVDKCVLVAIAQVLCVGTALTFYYYCRKYAEAKWRTAAPFVEMVPTTLVTPAVLLRGLLDFFERDKTPLPNFSQVTSPPLPSFVNPSINPNFIQAENEVDEFEDGTEREEQQLELGLKVKVNAQTVESILSSSVETTV